MHLGVGEMLEIFSCMDYTVFQRHVMGRWSGDLKIVMGRAGPGGAKYFENVMGQAGP